MKRLLEVCCGSLASVAAAVQGGAERIELCSALSLDGLTPSLGVLQVVRRCFPRLTIHVLIRPRKGDFVYSEAEVQAMLADIRAALPYADGLVVGALTTGGEVDLTVMERLMQCAEGRPVTFHRAFDACRNPHEALEQIVALGCRRILTSGQQPTALQGLPLLRQLSEQARGRLIVMPGGGVTSANARQILDGMGGNEIHGSLSALLPDGRKETSTQLVEETLGQLA